MLFHCLLSCIISGKSLLYYLNLCFSVYNLYFFPDLLQNFLFILVFKFEYDMIWYECDFFFSIYSPLCLLSFLDLEFVSFINFRIFLVIIPSIVSSVHFFSQFTLLYLNYTYVRPFFLSHSFGTIFSPSTLLLFFFFFKFNLNNIYWLLFKFIFAFLSLFNSIY